MEVWHWVRGGGREQLVLPTSFSFPLYCPPYFGICWIQGLSSLRYCMSTLSSVWHGVKHNLPTIVFCHPLFLPLHVYRINASVPWCSGSSWNTYPLPSTFYLPAVFPLCFLQNGLCRSWGLCHYRLHPLTKASYLSVLWITGDKVLYYGQLFASCLFHAYWR